MYRSAYQKGFLSVLYSVGSSPLGKWGTYTKNGYIKRIYDEDIKSLVLEIMGTNVSTTFIQSPDDCRQVKIQDDQRFMRRFRVSNFQSKTSVKPFCTAMPMGMSPGWNQIQFNLADFTRRAYGSNYLETVSLQIHANVRIRRIYFADRLYAEAELPNEYRLMGKPKDVKQPQKQYKIPATARPPSPMTTARSEEPKKQAPAPETTSGVDAVQQEMEAPPIDDSKPPEDPVSEAIADDVQPEEQYY